MTILHIIMEDIADVLIYMRMGFMIACVFTVILLLIQYISAKKINCPNILAWFLLFAYLVILVQVALLSREPGSRTTADLIPFSTWGDSLQSHAYVIENVLMFLPMGVLLPSALKFARKMGIVLLMSLGISAGIEWLQYVTERGYLQTDDVIMNVVGGMAGFAVWKAVMLFRGIIGE